MSAAPKSIRLEYSVSVTAAGGGTQKHSFDKTITIGRSPDNDIVISNDPRVSRNHVKIQVDAGQLKVINLSPKNEIRVNDVKVTEFYLNTETCKISLGTSTLEITARSSYGRAEAVPLHPVPPPPQALEVSNNQGGAVPQRAPSGAAIPAKPKPRPKRAPQRPGKKPPNPKMMLIILILVGGGAYLYLQESPKGSAPTAIRTAQERQEDEARALMTIDEERRRKQETGVATKMYDSAQAYYVRGFRDYRQGQFRRAMQSFQAALSFYPSHQLARKYLQLAEVQADKTDRLNMQQGRKYKARANYELCQASFQKVLTSIKDPENAVYKEAKVLFDVCRTLGEDKY